MTYTTGRIGHLVLSGFLVVVLLSPITDAQTNRNEIPTGEVAVYEIKESEKRQYPLDLQANEFLQVCVEQISVDVQLTLFDSNGRELAYMDTPNGSKGPETLSFIATVAGSYVLEISRVEGSELRGNYSIRREASRPATDRDIDRVEAERSFSQGMRLRTAKQFKLANAKFREARRGWVVLKDASMERWTSTMLISGLLDEADQINQGNKYLRADNLLREAIAKASEAVQLSQSIDDKYEESLSYFVIGNTYADMETPKYFQSALDNYQRALKVIELVPPGEHNLPKAKALLLKRTAEVLNNQDKTEESLATFRNALALLPEDDGDTRASIVMRIGNLQTKLRKFKDAEKSYLQAKAAHHRGGRVCDEGVVSNKLGDLYAQKDNDVNGSVVAARNAFIEAENLFAACSIGSDGYPNRRVVNLNALEDIYGRMNNRVKELEYQRKAKQLSKAASLQPEVLILNDFREGMEARYDEPLKAITLLTRALDAFEQRDADVSIRAMLLKEIAFAHVRLSRIYKARGLKVKQEAELALAGKTFDRAFTLVEKLGDKQPLAQLLLDYGRAMRRMGRLDDSIAAHLAALSQLISKENESRSQDFDLPAGITYSLAQSYLRKEMVPDALHYFRFSLWLRTTFGNKEEVADTLAGLQSVFEKLGKRRLAIFYGKLAVKLNLQFRESLKPLEIETQKDYLDSNRATYQELANLLIEEGRLAEAHQIVNRYQDQEFFDFAAARQSLFEPLFLTPAESESANEFERLSAELRKTGNFLKELNTIREARPLKEDEKGPLAAARDTFLETSKNFESKLMTIENDFEKPDSGNTTRPAQVPANTNEGDCTLRAHSSSGSSDTDKMKSVLCKLQQSPDAGRAAVVYTLTTEKFLRILLITSDGIQSFSTSMNESDVSANVQRMLSHLQKPQEDLPAFRNDLQENSDWYKASATLYQAIFRSESLETAGRTLEDELQQRKTTLLLWSVDDPLRNIPVNALYNPVKRQYLVEEYQNSVFTRSSPERFLNKSSRWTGCLGLGTSEEHLGLKALTGIQEDLRALCGNNVLINDDFKPGRISETILTKRPSAVFILSHFILWRGDAERSILVMGDGQGYSLNQMQRTPNLFAGVELLFLGGCETGTTEPGPLGNQADGFAELAQRLGARSVIATLWSVSPEGTSKLIRQFGRRHTEHLDWTGARILRAAQLRLLRNEVKDPKRPLRHPYYWAPFVFYGDFN